MARVLKGAHT